MKNIIKIFSLVIITSVLNSCEAQKVVVNREVETTNDGKMLLGRQTFDQFKKEPYSNWYNPEYDEYDMDEETIEQLKKEKLGAHHLTVFVGTWCEDSHREFPRLMKILDAVGFNEDRLTIIATNRKKESPNGEEGTFNIQYVPTIIVERYGKELGRIIETPNSGWLEKDLLEIIKKDNGNAVSELFKK